MLALLGASIVLARQIEFGVGLGFDSGHYVYGARQLLAGEPLLRLDGRDFTDWPPFFPVMLAAASVGVFDPLDVAGPLNAMLFGVMVLLCGVFLHRRLAARPLLAWCGCAAIAVSPPLVHHAATALPTQLFSLLVAGALICVAERDPGWRHLLLAAACTALACLTRYSGAALLAVVCAMLLGSSELRWPRRVLRAATFAIIAFAPLGLWLLRNQLLEGRLAGYRTHEPTALLDTLRVIGDQTATWVFLDLPFEDWFGAGWPMLLAAMALFALGAAALRKPFGRDVRHALLLFGVFVFAHLAVLLVATQQGTVVRLGPRYLLPLYVPCLFVVWLVLGEMLGPRNATETEPWWRRTPTRRRTILVSGTLVMGLWLAYQCVMHRAAIVERNLHGYHFDAPRWRESDALRHLREAREAREANNTGDRVYYALLGSMPAIYFFAGIVPSRYDCGDRGFARDGDHLLWLRQLPDSCLLQGQDDAFAMRGWELAADFADGVLVRFNAAAGTTLADAVWAHLVPSNRPVFGASWAVRLNAERRELVFSREPCATPNATKRFFVHVQPRSNKALPPHRRRSGFDNLDFDFPQRGFILPGAGRVGAGAGDAGDRASERAPPRRCVAVVELPRYGMASLRVGQFADQQLWAVDIAFQSDDGTSALRWSLRSDGL